MSWTWDQTDLTFDQTCWTFDGSNDCYPPAPPVSKPGGAGGGVMLRTYRGEPPMVKKMRLHREDNEILDFIVTILTKGLL